MFQRVCDLVATYRPGELETRERVGGLTALAWAAKKGDSRAIAMLAAEDDTSNELAAVLKVIRLVTVALKSGTSGDAPNGTRLPLARFQSK